MKKNMNANTENSENPFVDNSSSAPTQSNIRKSSNTKSSNSINSNSLNVILPQYTVIGQQQNLFDQNGKRTVQSSPSKSNRTLGQDSANKYKNVSDF